MDEVSVVHEGENVWGSEAIRQNCAQWTLAGDDKLLKCLESTSDGILTAANDISLKLKQTISETEKTNTRLHTVRTDILSLADSQFIENRVYDEDCSLRSRSEPPKDKTKAKAERDAEMLESIRLAMRCGCDVLETHFHKIRIRPEDLDEDDDPTFLPEPMFEPLDPYIERPLPFIIGTSEFVSSPDIGLRDEEDHIQEHVDSDAEEIVVSIEPPKPVERRQQSPIPIQAPSDSSGITGVSESSGSEPLFESPPQPAPQKNILDELESRMKREETAAAAKRAPEKPPDISKEASDSDGELFSEPPPLPSEGVGGSFSGGPDIRSGGLFDNDSDDQQDDLFSDLVNRNRSITAGFSGASKKSNAPRAAGSSLKRDQDKDAPKPKSSAVRVEKKAESILAPAAEDRKVFGGVAVLPPVSKQQPQPERKPDVSEAPKKNQTVSQPEKSSNWFDSDSDEDEMFRPTRKKMPVAPAAPKTAPSRQAPAPVLRPPPEKSIFSSDESDADLFEKLESHKKKSEPMERPKQETTGSKPVLSVPSANNDSSIFDDEEDGIFQSKPSGKVVESSHDRAQDSINGDYVPLPPEKDEVEEPLGSQLPVGQKEKTTAADALAAVLKGASQQPKLEKEVEEARKAPEEPTTPSAHAPLPSLAKSRARVPASRRRLPTKRGQIPEDNQKSTDPLTVDAPLDPEKAADVVDSQPLERDCSKSDEEQVPIPKKQEEDVQVESREPTAPASQARFLEDDDDEDIFAPKSEPVAQKPSQLKVGASAQLAPASTLFSESEEEDILPVAPPTKPVEAPIPTPAVEAAQTKKPEIGKSGAKNSIFDDDDSDLDLFK